MDLVPLACQDAADGDSSVVSLMFVLVSIMCGGLCLVQVL